MHKKTGSLELAEKLNISPLRAEISIIKAKLITEINKAVKLGKFTHEEISLRAGIPRSSITGILSGSLQKVTIERLLRILESVNLRAEIKIKKAA